MQLLIHTMQRSETGSLSSAVLGFWSLHIALWQGQVITAIPTALLLGLTDFGLWPQRIACKRTPGFQSQLHAWASYQIRKIACCACAGNAGNVFPSGRHQRKPLVSDPGMHHGTCVTHVPWCMPGSLTRGGGENFPGITGTCAPAILRIWQEAYGDSIGFVVWVSNYISVTLWDVIIYPYKNTENSGVKALITHRSWILTASQSTIDDLQWNFYKAITYLGGPWIQVVFINRENNHDFTLAAPGKWRNVCASFPCSKYRFYCMIKSHDAPYRIKDLLCGAIRWFSAREPRNGNDCVRWRSNRCFVIHEASI